MGIQELLKESWNNLKRVWVQLLVLNLVVFGLVLLIILGLVLFIGAGVLANLNTLSTNPAALLGLIGPFAVVIALAVVIFIALSLVAQGATILLLGTSDKYSLAQLLRLGLKLAFPLFVLGLVNFLFIIPAFFLFIIPGIVVSLFFMFSSYELVLGKRGVMESLKRSAYLVKNNFGFVFWRALLIFGLAFLISILSSQMGGGLLSWILGMVFGWYVQSYIVVLYKYLEVKTSDKKAVLSLAPFVVVAVVGYIAAGLIAYSVVRFLNTPEFREAFNQGFNQQVQKEIQSGDGNEFMSAYREQFVQSCTQGGQASAQYCECVADELINNYDSAKLTELSVQVLQEGTFPQEFLDAAASCNPQ